MSDMNKPAMLMGLTPAYGLQLRPDYWRMVYHFPLTNGTGWRVIQVEAQGMTFEVAAQHALAKLGERLAQ